MTNQPYLPADILKRNLSKDVIKERWLPPKLVSEILGVSPKWLAAAREGRKGIQGPPFVKLGEGRTAPIRYPLDALLTWMQSFGPYSTTTNATNSPTADYSAFLNQSAGSKQLWLFAIETKQIKIYDFIEAIYRDRMGDGIIFRWLSLPEFRSKRVITKKFVLDPEMIEKLLTCGNGDLSKGLYKLINKETQN
jgi:hypothetical protein